MTDADRLRAALTRSGLDKQTFARDVLLRDPRTLRRYLAGEPVPATVRAWLEREEQGT